MLPKDPVILLSVINTKLRDFYSDFDSLCDDMNVNAEEIKAILHEAGFEYDAERNQFI